MPGVFAPLFLSLKSDISPLTLLPFSEIFVFLHQKTTTQSTPTTFQTTLTTKGLEEDFISSSGVETLLEFVRSEGDDLHYDAAMYIMSCLMPFFPIVCERIGTNKEVIQIMVKHAHPTNSRKDMKFECNHTVISITTTNLRFISALEVAHDVLISSGVLNTALAAMENNKEGELSDILIIANLIGPSEAKESSHMVASEDILGKLLQIFEKGEFKERIVIFHTLFPAFRRLTVNDQNKIQLVKRGFVPIWISKLDEIKEDENTLSEMLEVMLNLSLLDENHPVLMEGGIPDILKKLASEQTVITVRHKKLMEQILWKLGVLQPHIKPPLANIPTTPETTQRPTIMLSYNWEHQSMVKDIAKKLKEEGYRVWLDLDEMVGSSVEAMANAVEMSQVVVVCLSRKYKESPNCRLEGEYAFKRRKVIIPLLMQPQYDADGWLGAIIGTKIYYKFTHTDLFEAGFQGLLKELNKLGFEKQPILTKQLLPISEQPTVITKSKIDPTLWNTTQVGEWLEGIGFGHHRAIFLQQEINGKALAILTDAVHKGLPKWAAEIVKPGGGLGFNTIGEFLCFLFELKKLFS